MYDIYPKEGLVVWLGRWEQGVGLQDGCLEPAEGRLDAPPGWAAAPRGEREAGGETEGEC